MTYPKRHGSSPFESVSDDGTYMVVPDPDSCGDTRPPVPGTTSGPSSAVVTVRVVPPGTPDPLDGGGYWTKSPDRGGR